MNYKYLIDSSIWIEYFGGTKIGKKVENIINNETIATSIMAVAELADKFERENHEFSESLKFIQSRATILQLSINIVLQAAKLKKELRYKNSKFGIVDAIHLATSRNESTQFITADNDFIGIKDVIIINGN